MAATAAAVFGEMQNTFFSFEAYTKLWLGLAPKIPAKTAGDLHAVRQFLMTPGNADEVTFTGRLTIYRGTAGRDEKSNAAFIPMTVVDMDEVGYSKSLDTTIRVTADFTKPNFGYTFQTAPTALAAPAEARMLMTLRFEGISGAMAAQLNAAKATTDKQISATIHSFPFTNGAAIFQHVGEAARPIKAQSGEVIGYLAHGIMIPQFPLGDPVAATPQSAAAYQLGKIPAIPKVSAAEQDFLMRKTATVAG